jgi:FlaA1/EpsC-like NDP-sugar epimerase
LTAVEQAVAQALLPKPALHVSHSAPSGWARSCVRRFTVTDASVVVTSVAIAQFARSGTNPAMSGSEGSVYSYTAVSAVLILAWLSALILFRTRERRVVGTGVEEFRRVGRASTALFGTVAIISFLLKLQVARGYLAVALPLGLASLLLTRWLWRRWLAKERSEGRFISTVLVVGSHNAAAAMAQEF